MATLADSLLSSSARPLGLRMRPDLTAHQQRYQGRLYWVIKDPVGLNYFRFQEEEFALMKMLDGRTSLDDLKRSFEELFAPQQISVEELGQFVGMLHRSGLVIADMPGQGRQLLKRRGERKRQEFLGALSNILAIRFKGIDPERMFRWLYPLVKWFFTRTAFVLCVLFAMSALLLVLVNFDDFWNKLPTFHQFFRAGNWVWLALVVACTKVLHEFGHGMSCKHFGGECHELGFMMLVLTPCLYCNVSDSWMLPSKWHRAAIGAAGMYVELVLASIATYVWWFSEPGLTNELALNVMFVCSVSTLVFNANPLLRYDGYYILSDLSEIPNLRQKATTILSRKLGAWCLGLEEPEDPFLPHRNQVFFALYSVASALYGWFVTFSILLFLYRVFEPYHLEVIGQMIGMAAIVGLVVRPLWQLGKFFYVPGRLEQVKKGRVRITVALAVVAIAAILFVPFPYSIPCPLTIEARGAKTVYIEVPGELTEVLVKAGQKVQKGQLLARLTNKDIEISLADLEAHKKQYEAQIAALMRQRFSEKEANNEIPHIQKSLEAVEDQIKQKEQDLSHLELRAPVDGWVIPPADVPEPPEREDTDKLPSWWGSPLDAKNLGAYLKTGTTFCQVGDPKRMQAALVIDQSDVDLVSPKTAHREGSRVSIKLDEMPHDTFYSEVVEVSNMDLKQTPRELSHKYGGELQTKTDQAGIERPMTASYQALAPLDNDQELIFVGLRGRGKIGSTRWLSVGARVYRWFGHTFHFKL